MAVSDEEAASKKWNEQLRDFLNGLQIAGRICETQRLDDVPPLQPKLHVKGLVERVAFPLPSSQARDLIAIAENSKVAGLKSDQSGSAARPSRWKIDASQITFQDPGPWDEYISEVLDTMMSKMGILDDVKHVLSCMVLSEAGEAHDLSKDFVQDDGSKAFGVLQIQLPSFYQGGAMTALYDEEFKIELSECEALSQDAFFATTSYVDCRFHIDAITSGYQTSLIYQLVSVPPLPSASTLVKFQSEMRDIVASWEKGTVRGYLLEEKFNGNILDLIFTNLAGHDSRIINFLSSITGNDGLPIFVVYLALVEKWEIVKIIEGSDELDEVLDSQMVVKSVVDADGKILSELSAFPFDFDWDLLHNGEEVEEIFGDQPDEVTRHQGDEFEMSTYRVVALFWPRSLEDTIVFKATSILKRDSADHAVGMTSGKRSRIEVLHLPGAGCKEDPFVLDD